MESRYTILVIDGSSHMRKLYRMVISKRIRGCCVLEAATLAQARTFTETKHPCLIILEAEMPDGSGFDFCREVCRENEIPVLLATGLDSEKNISEGYAAGCGDYLIKPYLIDTLTEHIESLLRQTERKRE